MRRSTVIGAEADLPPLCHREQYLCHGDNLFLLLLSRAVYRARVSLERDEKLTSIQKGSVLCPEYHVDTLSQHHSSSMAIPGTVEEIFHH